MRAQQNDAFRCRHTVLRTSGDIAHAVSISSGTRCTVVSRRCPHARCSPNVREYRTRILSGNPRASRSSRIASHRDTRRRVGRHWRRASRGSTDIKITSHAAQKATCSCIVVQECSWLHPALRTARTTRG